jgi:hypothetical protein
LRFVKAGRSRRHKQTRNQLKLNNARADREAQVALTDFGKIAHLADRSSLQYQRLMMLQTNLVLLNASILTEYGMFKYRRLTLDEAQLIVREFQAEGKTIESAIGHQSTADLLTMLLRYPVAANRIEFKQGVGDLALVFKLKGRPPEGKVLSREEIESLGYEFGLIERIS